MQFFVAIIAILTIIYQILCFFDINRTDTKYENRRLLTKSVQEVNINDYKSGNGQEYHIRREDDVIKAEYGTITNDGDYTIEKEMVWSEEKYEAYLNELYKCKVMSWKSQYFVIGEEEPDYNKYWGFYISFITGDDFYVNGYNRKPINFNKVMRINKKFFKE